MIHTATNFFLFCFGHHLLTTLLAIANGSLNGNGYLSSCSTRMFLSSSISYSPRPAEGASVLAMTMTGQCLRLAEEEAACAACPLERTNWKLCVMRMSSSCQTIPRTFRQRRFPMTQDMDTA